MKIVKPKTYSAKDMYKFWKKEQKRKYPYLQEKYNILYYTPINKINYLRTELILLNSDKYLLEDKDKHNINRYTRRTKNILSLTREINKIKKEIKELESLLRGKTVQIMNYTLFKEIIARFNKKMSHSLVFEGKTLNLCNTLGYLKIKKIERNLTKDHIDWPASHKLKQRFIEEGKEIYSKDNPNGKKWFVYRSDPWYLRWGWIKNKGACRVKNQTVYSFNPTANRSNGMMGNKGLLSRSNMDDSLLHFKYDEK